MQINPDIQQTKPSASQRRRFQSFTSTRRQTLAGEGETSLGEVNGGVKVMVSAKPEEFLGRQGQPDGE